MSHRRRRHRRQLEEIAREIGDCGRVLGECERNLRSLRHRRDDNDANDPIAMTQEATGGMAEPDAGEALAPPDLPPEPAAMPPEPTPDLHELRSTLAGLHSLLHRLETGLRYRR